MNTIYYIKNYKNPSSRQVRTASIVLAIAFLAVLISPSIYVLAWQPDQKVIMHKTEDIDHKSTDNDTFIKDKNKPLDHSNDDDKEYYPTQPIIETPIPIQEIVVTPSPTQEVIMTPTPTPTPTLVVSNNNNNQNNNSNDNHTDVNVTNNNNVNITNNPQQTATVQAAIVENTQVQPVVQTKELPGTGVPATAYELFSLLPLGVIFRKIANLG